MRRWIAIALALAVGLFMVGVDQRSDDTGIEATILLVSAFTFTALAPRGAIAVALAVGLPIAVLNAGWPALLFSCAGATLGYAMGRLSKEGRSVSRPG